MTQGLVIGKFYPPHKGHNYLIEIALQETNKVDVLVCDDPAWAIPATQRAAWLQQLHPDATVHIIPDIGMDDDSVAWAEHTIQFLGYRPDVVFSSEDYGDAYALHMGAKHRLVDKPRRKIPISARKIRADVLKKWNYLSPVVRADYCQRVVVIGAESTGGTTLSKALAKHYQTVWVPEYGRLYSEAKLQEGGKTVDWISDEFNFIATEQQRLENQMAGLSNGLLICDTNAFATSLWHERYMGHESPTVNAIGAQDKVDLYIITNIDIPFVQDGLRDGEHIRAAMHVRFIEEISESTLPFCVVGGTVEQRLKSAIKIIDQLRERKVTI